MITIKAARAARYYCIAAVCLSVCQSVVSPVRRHGDNLDKQDIDC